MKKIMNVSLCLLLVSAMAITAFAANKASFFATASADTLYRGDTVTLTVNVDCAEQATSYGLMLTYDTAVFELVDGTCTVGGTLVSSFNNGFAFMYQNPTAYSGAVGTVTLKVKDDAAFGAATVTGDASIKNGTADIAATGCSASVTIACKHSYSAWTESGTGHAQTCSTCGDVKTADHSWDKGTTIKEATCTEEGKIKFACTACSATKEEPVAMIDHAYGAWTSVDENSHKHICAACQLEETAAHAFATELTTGEKTHWYGCVCGEKKDEAVHAFDEKVWNKNETAHWHSCVCGAIAGEAAHAWDDGKVTTEATQKEEGVKTYTCKDCAATKTEKISKLPTNPQTGDEMLIVSFALLMILSASGVVVATVARKRTAR